MTYFTDAPIPKADTGFRLIDGYTLQSIAFEKPGTRLAVAPVSSTTTLSIVETQNRSPVTADVEKACSRAFLTSSPRRSTFRAVTGGASILRSRMVDGPYRAPGEPDYALLLEYPATVVGALSDIRYHIGNNGCACPSCG